MRSRSHWLEGERHKEIRECVVERRGSIQRASLQPQLGDRDRDQSSPCGKKTFSADLQKSLRVQYVYSPSQPAIPRHETASLMAGHGTDECDLGQQEEDGSHKGKNSTCTVRHISRGWTAVVVTCPHMKTNSSWGTSPGPVSCLRGTPSLLLVRPIRWTLEAEGLLRNLCTALSMSV